MKQIDIIFVLVNYDTPKDLELFLISTSKRLNLISYKVICVDNYSNENNYLKILNLKEKYNFELVNNENNGYGGGNNAGIKFAIENFEFKYLIVSNCDIEINKLDINSLNEFNMGIIAPFIKNKLGKSQNPMYIRRHNIIFLLFQFANNSNNIFIQKLGIIISKLFFVFDNILINRNSKTIYSCHGSFIIFPQKILMKLHPVFDEEMFLLCEEIVLAEKAKKAEIKIYYQKEIKVTHYEDASMKDYNTQQKNFRLWQQSYNVFLKKYFNNY